VSDKKKFYCDWRKVFEAADYLYFYGDFLTQDRSTREVDFLIKELKLGKPMSILDLACGHGRHSNRLAELGYQVIGIDITQDFIDIARKDAHKKKIFVKYLRQDMRKIQYKNEFDRILLLFTAFGYYEDDVNLSILKKISRALKKDGLFCFDIPNRDGMMKILLPAVVTEKDKDMMIDLHNFDSINGKLYNKRIVIRNGQRKEKPFFVRLYNPTEIIKMLHQAGMQVSKIYADWDGSQFRYDSKKMIIITQKK
jgi:SAM-dependent methyltransferase